jgi:hypothetical protein
MYYFIFEGAPDPESEFADREGCYAACWINFIDFHGARALAEFYLQDAPVRDLELTEAYEVSREDYTEPDDAESIGYFDEAVRDGASIVIHWFAHEDEETGAPD